MTHRFSLPHRVAAALTILGLGIFGAIGCDDSGDTDILDGALEPSAEQVLEGIEVPPMQQEIPPIVTAYEVIEGCERIPMAALKFELGVQGTPEVHSEAPGVVFVEDDTRRLTMYADGTATFVDTQYVNSVSPAIEPVPAPQLLADGEALLDAMGALDDPYVTLAPGRVELRLAEVGAAGASVLTHQIATFLQSVDHIPAMGPGAKVEVVYPGDLFAVAFRSPLRCLQPEEVAHPVTQAEAVVAWRIRAINGGPWSVHEHADLSIDAVEIDAMQLGHYVPDVDEFAPSLDPVYKITGTVKGTYPDGEQATVPFLWFEPAVQGRPIPPSI